MDHVKCYEQSNEEIMMRSTLASLLLDLNKIMFLQIL